MQLEDYFDFLGPDQIRIKGHRVGIEHILYAYIHQCRTPEEISKEFTSVTLEEIYATILYYLHNRDAVSKYLADWIEWGRARRAEQANQTDPFLERIRKLK